MQNCLTLVIPSTARDLVLDPPHAQDKDFSAESILSTSKDLEMTIVTQFLLTEEHS